MSYTLGFIGAGLLFFLAIGIIIYLCKVYGRKNF